MRKRHYVLCLDLLCLALAGIECFLQVLLPVLVAHDLERLADGVRVAQQADVAAGKVLVPGHCPQRTTVAVHEHRTRLFFAKNRIWEYGIL